MIKKTAILIVFLSMFFAGQAAAIPNPAPVYCDNMGYAYNDTHCIFSDNESCEIWDFFNGECGQGYVVELPCKGSGESLPPGYECCEGLTSVGVSSPGPNGTCMMIEGPWPVCIACGDGFCDNDTENTCNCPGDCIIEFNQTGGENYTCPLVATPMCSEGTELKTYIGEDGCIETITCEATVGGPGIVSVCQNHPGCAGAINRGTDDDGCIIWECPDGDAQAGDGAEGDGSPTATAISIEKTSGQTLIKEGNVEVVTSADAKMEQSKLYIETSAGKIEVKVSPGEAHQKAAAEITRVNEIELLEESQNPVYSVKGTKQAAILFLIPVSMDIETRINAETGDIISVSRPWWSFIAW